jgi:hypothetical protein
VKEAKKFAVGDKVKWTSGGRATREKEGEVIAVIPAGTDPLKLKIPAAFKGLRCLWEANRPRGEESYIVKVFPGTTGRAKPVLYWPWTVSLNRG